MALPKIIVWKGMDHLKKVIFGLYFRKRSLKKIIELWIFHFIVKFGLLKSGKKVMAIAQMANKKRLNKSTHKLNWRWALTIVQIKAIHSLKIKIKLK